MDVVHWLHTIPHEAIYLIVALIVGIESLGVPVPGELTLITAALLASQGIANPVLVGLAGVIGASTGDSIGYYIGHRGGARLLNSLERRFPHHFDKRRIAVVKRVFARHGMWTVFFGRFIAILRIFAGPLAGVLKFPYSHFLIANISGAILWSSTVTAVVYFVGVAAEVWLKDASWVALLITLTVGGIMVWLFKSRFEELVEREAK